MSPQEEEQEGVAYPASSTVVACCGEGCANLHSPRAHLPFTKSRHAGSRAWGLASRFPPCSMSVGAGRPASELVLLSNTALAHSPRLRTLEREERFTFAPSLRVELCGYWCAPGHILR